MLCFVGFFAAFGMLCAGMVLLGAFLGQGQQEGFLLTQGDGMYFLWLRAMGIFKGRIYRVTSPKLWQVIREHTEEITSWDEGARLMTGAEEIDRSGNGDSTGDHQCGGVSEL